MVIDPAIANDIFMLGGYDRGWVSISHVARSPVIFGVGCLLIYMSLARAGACGPRILPRSVRFVRSLYAHTSLRAYTRIICWTDLPYGYGVFCLGNIA